MGEQVLEGKSVVELPTLHRAYLADRESGGIRCGVCHQHCLITEGARGTCDTRINIGGELFTMTYGDVIACESRPVELKPFFHLKPGTTHLTICCPSCNFECRWCQNHHYSGTAPRPLKAEQAGMRDLVAAAQADGDTGICVSLTEPLMMFEYTLGLFREAAPKGLDCAYVTNGYMTPDALHMLHRAGLNAMSIDVKGDEALYREYCGAREGDLPVWENVRDALQRGMHVEVVHLAVTGLNDNKASFDAIVSRHLEFAGPDVPLHVTAYTPDRDYLEPATAAEFLEWAYGEARERGIRFAYVGNVAGHPGENTYCPECGRLALERLGPHLERDMTEENRCASCGYTFPIRR